MELYMVCVLIAIALGMLIYKGLLFMMFVAYPLPGETRELKWKRAPSLPMQELGRRFAAKSDKIRRNRGQPTRGSGHGSSTSSSAARGLTREKQPLAHAEIPMENIELEDPVVVRPSSRPSSRGQGGRDNFGTVV